MSKTSDFITGVIIGAAVGSVAALLYAPEKGKTMRDKLSYKVSHYTDELTAKIEQLRKERDRLVSEAKERGNQVVDEAREKAEDLMQEAEELLHNASEALDDKA